MIRSALHPPLIMAQKIVSLVIITSQLATRIRQCTLLLYIIFSPIYFCSDVNKCKIIRYNYCRIHKISCFVIDIMDGKCRILGSKITVF